MASPARPATSPNAYAHPREHLADCVAALALRFRLRLSDAGGAEADPAQIAERDLLRRAREEAFRAGIGPLPLDRIAAAGALSPFDVDALLAVVGPSIDPGLGALYAQLQNRPELRMPTAELLSELLAAPEQRGEALLRFAPGAPLMEWLLIAGEGEAGRTTRAFGRPLAVDVQVLGWLLGTEALDPREQPWERLPPADPEWAEVFGRELGVLASRLSEDRGGPACVHLRGADGVEAEDAARVLADRAGLRLFAVDAQLLLGWARHSDARLRGQLRLLEREARFWGGAILVRGADRLTERGADPAPERHACARALLDRTDRLFLQAEDPALGAAFTSALRAVRWLELNLSDGALARRTGRWSQRLGADAAQLPEAFRPQALAASHPFPFSQVDAAVGTARALARSRDSADAALTPQDLAIALERHGRRELGALAQEVKAVHRWEDLVLPADSLAQLHELCGQVRQRHTVLERWGFRERLQTGLGVNALFCGPPGTGKTMAASIVARELGLPLHKIELSMVVSKYLGETEKHLGQLFRDAAAANVVLFFDEAEALFSKRTKVEDSHDRYANLETGYLLQQIEAYPGVALLATNLSENLDSAFLRRLGFVIDFPFPTPADRQRILESLLPARAPRGKDLRLGYLAERFHFSGGNLRNVVLHAAYAAARESAPSGAPIGMKHLLRAARRELLKLGRPFVSADYPEYRGVFDGEG